MSEPKKRDIVRLFLQVVGALIAGLSGLCTGGILLQSGRDEYGIKKLSLVVGGVPFLIGILLFWLGSRKSR